MLAINLLTVGVALVTETSLDLFKLFEKRKEYE